MLNLDFGKRPGFRDLFTFLHRLLEERLGAVSRLRCPIMMSHYLTFGWLSTSPQAEPTGRSHLSSRMHHQGDSKSADKHLACSLQKRQQAYDFGEATGSGRSAAPSHGLLLKITRHRSQGLPQALWGPRHPAQPSPGPLLTPGLH